MYLVLLTTLERVLADIDIALLTASASTFSRASALPVPSRNEVSHIGFVL